jgi:DNA polymerase-3 subunit gamma/tau
MDFGMSTQYTVLARRFRPQTFSDVVGQDHIARTLRNAILENRVAHAYLFTGARGVGKTSMARIFAKALNCPQAVDAVPCNQCEICTSIAAGQDVDVSEIDGASNRGIDDIRTLRANVNIRSMRSKYKVYIIDEVHMLTREAFNALLKTLEEPPPAVKFVFCTTEPNKVPDTILSRCQRFDFGTVSAHNIMVRLEQIAIAEGFDLEPAALQLLARRAAGSMRDSQSLLDQVLAGGEKRVTADDVHHLLGTAPDEVLVEVMDAVFDQRRDLALDRFQAALDGGVSADALVEQLILYFRDLMVRGCGVRSGTLLGVAAESGEDVDRQASRWPVETLVAGLQILADTKARMARVTFGRALAELALVRLASLEQLVPLAESIAVLKANSGAAVPVGRSAAGPEKKNDTAAVARESRPEPVISSTPDQRSVLPASTAASEPGPVPAQMPAGSPEAAGTGPLRGVWEAGDAAAVFASLCQSFPDMTGTHLRRAVSTAISGPNALDLSYPAGYNLGWRALSSPETVSKIEDTLQRLVGERIRVRLVPVDSPATTVVAEATRVPEPPPRRWSEMSDPLVDHVARLLGVEEWSCMQAPPDTASRPPETDEED